MPRSLVVPLGSTSLLLSRTTVRGVVSVAVVVAVVSVAEVVAEAAVGDEVVSTGVAGAVVVAAVVPLEGESLVYPHAHSSADFPM